MIKLFKRFFSKNLRVKNENLQEVDLKKELTPGEILLLSYADRFSITENKFPKYWEEDYQIQNPKKVLSELFKEGFIKNADLNRNLECESAVNLKEFLKKNKLPISGTKEILVKRIIDNIQKKDIKEIFFTEYYEITEKGNEILDNNGHLIFINQNRVMNIDIFEIDKLVKLHKEKNYKEIIVDFLNKESLEHLKTNNFGLYRNSLLNIYKICVLFEKYSEAFEYLCKVIYCDLNNCSNNFEMGGVSYFYEERFYIKDIYDVIPSGIVKFFNEIRSKLNKEKIIVENNVTELFNTFNEEKFLPLIAFTPKECKNILYFLLDENLNEIKKIYKIAKIRFKDNYL